MDKPKEMLGKAMIGAAATQKPLVVVGSVNADVCVGVNRLPKPGETLSGRSLEYFPGGKALNAHKRLATPQGANQAVAAAKLGYPTYFMGQIGRDSNAAMLRTSLESCSVNLSHLRELDGPSGTALILLQEGGENSIIIVGGANQTGWAISDADRALLRSAGAVLLQREIPEEINAEVARIAKASGVPVILDAGGIDAELGADLLSNVAVLSPNETELARLTGMDTSTIEKVDAAAKTLQGHGIDSVLVKLGSDGSYMISNKHGPVRQHIVKAKKVVDTTGAGDCFTAAFAVAVLEGRAPQEALLFASAAASICVQSKGAQPSMPVREQVDKLLASL